MSKFQPTATIADLEPRLANVIVLDVLAQLAQLESDAPVQNDSQPVSSRHVDDDSPNVVRAEVGLLSVLPRPFAVDYAEILTGALAYSPNHKHAFHNSPIYRFGDFIAGLFDRSKSGTWTYYDALRSDGILLAGSTAAGPFFREVISSIGDAVYQLLGPQIVAIDLGGITRRVYRRQQTRSTQTYEILISDAPQRLMTFGIADWPIRTRTPTVPDILTNEPNLTLGLERDSQLAAKIRALSVQDLVEQESQADGRIAIEEAAIFVERELPIYDALVSISDDGVVTLKWSRDSHDFVLLFAGDGSGTFASRGPGELYGTNYSDFALINGLPDEARKAIESMNLP